MERSSFSSEVETQAGMKLARAPEGEEVCITGISGKFPESGDMHELRDNLFAKRDLISEDKRRWDIDAVSSDIPKGTGKIKELRKFDASFFGIYTQQAEGLDPMLRILMETTYEAIVDAGVNPRELRGTRTGIFVGLCSAESETAVYLDTEPVPGKTILSSTRTGYPNRLSYWLQVNGPSYVVDTACSSSLYALDHGYKAIRDGQCDQAIVAGVNLVMQAFVVRQFFDLGVLTPDSRCKSFDENADGYVRSEAVSAIFLQKTRDSRRVYATVVHSKTNNDGFKPEGITFPSRPLQQQLLEDFYQECNIDPVSVAWVEAHATGTAVGDPEECSALAKVFCAGRDTPLPVGSVKSNLGHTEPASGLCSIAKVVIAMETGLIPPNINLDNLKSSVPSLVDGRLQVVTSAQPWDGGLVGINSFGFGGANAHVCLRWNDKSKVAGGVPSDGLPRLVAISGRTKEGVEGMLIDMESRPVDADLVRLYHAVHAVDTPSHVFRGYAVLALGKSRHHVQRYDAHASRRRPVWLVLPGVAGPGHPGNVLAFPAMAKAVDACQLALPADCPDLKHLVCQDIAKLGPEDAILALAAFQVGMVHVLRSVGVRPDRIVGCAVGQLAAGYADDCFSLKQTMLAAHAVAIGMRETYARKINDVGSEGFRRVPLDKDNRRADVFAWDRDAVGDDKDSLLMERLKQVLANSKPRSERWTDSFKGCPELASAEFVFSSLVSLSSRLHEVVPSDAIVVMASPSKDAVDCLLTALGQVFEDGADLPLAELYPPVEFPVSRGTPMIAPLVRWEHARDWHVEDHQAGDSKQASMEATLKVSVKESRQKFYKGHVVDGRNLFPATGYLFFVWQTLKKKLENKGTVVFEDVRFLRSTNIPASGSVVLSASIQKVTGRFEVEEGGVAVVTGRVYFALPGTEPLVDIRPHARAEGDDGIMMSSRDIYKELRLRGYDYSGLFRGLVSADSTGSRGKIRWADANWVAFMDNMLQMQILSADTRGLFVPTTIARLSIDEDEHIRAVKEASEGDWEAEPVLDVFSHAEAGIIRAGGVEVRGLNASAIKRRKYLGVPVLEKQVFLPDSDVSDSTKPMDFRDAFCACVHVGLENHASVRVKAVELYDDDDIQLLTPELTRVLADLPMIQTDLHVLTQSSSEPKLAELEPKLAELEPKLAEVDPKLAVFEPKIAEGDPKPAEFQPNLAELEPKSADQEPKPIEVDPKLAELEPSVQIAHRELDPAADSGATFVLGARMLMSEERMRAAVGVVGSDGFILTVESAAQTLAADAPVDLLTEFRVEGKKLMLLRKRRPLDESVRVLQVHEADPSWLEELQTMLSENPKSTQRVVLVSIGEPINGLLGFFNCLRKEPAGQNVRCFVLDSDAPSFDASLPVYAERLAKDLAVNVLRGGRWGSFRHLPLGASVDKVVPHVYANVTTIGDLGSFRWLQGSIDPASWQPKAKEQLVHVYSSAINFKDVMIATGRLAVEVVCPERIKQDCLLGIEFSGRTPEGRRVMGMVESGALASMVVADADMLWDVPDGWSMRDAATVITVYATALYALVEIGRMKRGDKVLIHAGSGGVGQAAIQVALHTGAQVFTTVGSPEKRAFIKQRFPQISDSHIGNSRDTSFEQLVLRETNGLGVDLVLNSLVEEKLQASIRCLARGGRFLEIGKFDIAANNTIDRRMLPNETSFHGVMVDLILTLGGPRKRVLHDLLSRAFKEGVVVPLNSTVFPAEEVQQAFRFMGSGKHIGKVLLNMRDEEEGDHARAVVPETLTFNALPRFSCNPQKTYIIVGGLGGFGLELADWLVLRGARHLVLSSRNGLRTGYQSARVRTWRSYGATVQVSTADVCTEEGVANLLDAANNMVPVAGIFNLAVVLRDALFEDQTSTGFREVAAPKALATRLLDAASRRLCPELAHFVVFSSVSCGRGNAGQTSYGAANSAMERLCELRAQQGLPALAVQWGAVGQVGLVADMRDDDREVVIGGTLPQHISSCLSALDGFMCQGEPVVASMVVAEKRSCAGAGSMLETVAAILGITNLKSVSHQSTLAEMGMDSMTAVEVKQTLEREFQVFLTPIEIRGLTLARVVELSAGLSATTTPTAGDGGQGDNEMGIALLLRFLGDEKAAYECTVTLDSAAQTTPRTVLMIPGIEGVAASLQPLAARLSARAIGLQGTWATDTAQTMEGLAKELLPHAIASLPAGNTFNLIGYSFGGVVALHLASLLEEAGLRGSVFIIDGAPDLMLQIGEPSLVNPDVLHADLLVGILSLVQKPSAAQIKQLRADLALLSSWAERLQFTLALIDTRDYSVRYAEDMANNLLRRSEALKSFDWSDRRLLESRVTLLRPAYRQLGLPADCGLGKFCRHPVEAYLYDESHVSILENKEVAEVINCQINDDSTFLDTKI